MKKIKFTCVLLLIFLLVSGCALLTVGEDGDTYLAFSWGTKPLRLYDENPSIPDTIYNNQYYETNEGSFYMEYTAWDGSAWWMRYSITANSGTITGDGGPAYFDISLYYFGPTIYKWSYPRQISPNSQQLPETQYEQNTINGTTILLEYGLLNE